MSELTLIVDVRSLNNGEQLIAKAGTVVDFMSNEGNYVIAQLEDGSISFPLESDEYTAIDDGRTTQENAPAEDVLYMDRGKSPKHKDFDLSRKLGVGFYTPSQSFKNMPEMTAVFFADNMTLVATTGPAHDAESESYAQLFADAPELALAKAELLEALKEAEVVLSQKWNLETMNFNRGKGLLAVESPNIYARIKDKYNLSAHPTAAALVTVRNAIVKHGNK